MKKPTEEPVDEQGAPWPPPECPVARVRSYGGDDLDPLNGSLVSLGPYLAEHGLFETYLCESVGNIGVAGPDRLVLCKPGELDLLNDAACAHAAFFLDARVEFYEDEVYDLRDLLSGVGVQVKAESVSGWGPAERELVRRYALATRDLPESRRPPKPEVLP